MRYTPVMAIRWDSYKEDKWTSTGHQGNQYWLPFWPVLLTSQTSTGRSTDQYWLLYEDDDMPLCCYYTFIINSIKIMADAVLRLLLE